MGYCTWITTKTLSHTLFYSDKGLDFKANHLKYSCMVINMCHSKEHSYIQYKNWSGPDTILRCKMSDGTERLGSRSPITPSTTWMRMTLVALQLSMQFSGSVSHLRSHARTFPQGILRLLRESLFCSCWCSYGYFKHRFPPKLTTVQMQKSFQRRDKFMRMRVGCSVSFLQLRFKMSTILLSVSQRALAPFSG